MTCIVTALASPRSLPRGPGDPGGGSPRARVSPAGPGRRVHELQGLPSAKWRGGCIFYPKDGIRRAATTQACEFRGQHFPRSINWAPAILGISVDDVASHKQFAEEHSLPFTLLGGQHQGNRPVLRRAGQRARLMEIPSARTSIINPEGRVAEALCVGGSQRAFAHGARGLEGPAGQRPAAVKRERQLRGRPPRQLCVAPAPPARGVSSAGRRPRPARRVSSARQSHRPAPPR